jgi:hypothetical protein
MFVLAFVTRLMVTKSKFAFFNNFYTELLKLIGDVLPTNHKLSRDIDIGTLKEICHRNL